MRSRRKTGQLPGAWPSFLRPQILVSSIALLLLVWNTAGRPSLGQLRGAGSKQVPDFLHAEGGVGEHASALVATRSVVLYNNVTMPRLGLGTAGLGEETAQVVTWALEAGYRLIDSAQAREWYREDLVGEALRQTAIPRAELFIVSKLHPRHTGYAITRERFEDTLKDLGTEYLDLFLLHYPWCFSGICGEFQPQGTWRDSWRALEDLHKLGKIKAIGVSNFSPSELETLLTVATVRPHVVQQRSDPLSADAEMQRLCIKQKIQFMGYSTLGAQWFLAGHRENPVLGHPVIADIAAARKCSPVQVVLKWALVTGQVVIPRTRRQEKLVENLASFKCPLLRQDVTQLQALDKSL